MICPHCKKEIGDAVANWRRGMVRRKGETLVLESVGNLPSVARNGNGNYWIRQKRTKNDRYPEPPVLVVVSVEA